MAFTAARVPGAGQEGLRSHPATAVRLARNVSARRVQQDQRGYWLFDPGGAAIQGQLHRYCQSAHGTDLQVGNNQVGAPFLKGGENGPPGTSSSDSGAGLFDGSRYLGVYGRGVGDDKQVRHNQRVARHRSG